VHSFITGALNIFIVDGRWASFNIADSLVVIGEFS
jgi:lipoprotein signal peptidase